MNNLDVKRLDDGDYSPQEIVELFVQFQWQPIETAPKDTRILLWTDEDGIQIGANFIIKNYYRWIANDNISSRMTAPTHWMPLPEAPIKKGTHHQDTLH